MTLPAVDLGQAAAALDACRGLLDAASAAVKARCTAQGKVSAAAMDAHQVAAYELAQAAAEYTAARLVLEYARRAQGAPGARLESQLAALVAAETVASLRARLWARPDDFGVPVARTQEALGSGGAAAFAAGALAAPFLEALGEAVMAAGNPSGVRLLDAEHAMMGDTFRKFADTVVAPRAEAIHRGDLDIPDEIIGPLTELNCFGLSIPERFGGLQPDDREDNMGMIAVTEELSRGSLGAAGSLITRPEILARALLKGGTPAQQAHWLPKLAAGDPLCAVAVTEPDYGSDVAAMKMPATRTPGGWLLDGTKTWCTFGGKAGVLLVLARTDPDPKAGHRGLSVFLAEKPAFPGHSFEYTQPGGGRISGRAIHTIGYRGMHSFEVFFENYFVPDDNLLGGEAGLGQGFYYIMAGFAGGRIQTAARALGVMQAAFEAALKYAGERKVFGQPVASYQLTRAKLARMAALLCACRQFTYAVGRLMDEGKGQMEASMVKFFACKTAEWVTREAMQIHGGMGYAEETAVSRYFVDARVLSIFEGAEETLALKVIAKALIENGGL